MDRSIGFLHILSEKTHKALEGLCIVHEYNEDFGRVRISMGVFTSVYQYDISKFEIL